MIPINFDSILSLCATACCGYCKANTDREPINVKVTTIACIGIHFSLIGECWIHLLLSMTLS
jgi:hypothetical protein